MAGVAIDDIVSTASLLRIFNGVLVATRFPEAEAEAVGKWLQRSSEHGSSFSEWLDSITPSIFGPNSSAQQHLASLVLAITFLRHRSRQQAKNSPCNLSPADLNLIWTLIHNALLSLPTITVTRSSQGFIAIPLCSLINAGNIEELLRFHVWLPDGKRGCEDTAVHARQPYARSWVLAGQGRDFSYHTEPVEDPDMATHAKYRLAWSGGDGKPLASSYGTHHRVSVVQNSGQLVRLREVGTALHGRDETYAVPAGAFHRSCVKPDAFHATLFYFDSSKGFDQDAPVLGPKHGTEYAAVKEMCGQSAAELARLVDDARKGDEGVLEFDVRVDEAISMAVEKT